MEPSLLKKKFRGCLLGGLVGDCLGNPYERRVLLLPDERVELQKSLDKLEKGQFKGQFRAPILRYTDDSAMTLSVARSLIENNGLDVMDLAKKFVQSYFHDTLRGYGPAIYLVFYKLRENGFSDLVKPASEQFNGEGSMGNGGAMRIGPVVLYCYNDYDKLIEMTKAETHLTHTHKCGINGTILQAIAIRRLLLLDPKDTLNVQEFLDYLIDEMDKFERNEEASVESQNCEMPFKTKLTLIKRMIEDSLKDATKPSMEDVIKILGNNMKAPDSVPTAIFCFLRAQNPIEGINTKNPLRRAIQYVLTLGGDADTIGCMAGALGGAYYGADKLNAKILKNCESSEVFAGLADKLFDIAANRNT